MSDGYLFNPSGASTAASDDIGGVHYPRAKLVWGPDGTANDTDTATGKPMPVQLRSSTGTDLIGTAGTASAAVLSIQGIASGTVVPVSIASVPSHAVTNAGTFAVQATNAGTFAVQSASAGDVAHDAADSGNPVKGGAKAIAALSGTTLVSAADRTNNQSDLDGALIVRNSHALGDLVSGNASNTDGSSTQVIAAAAAGIKTYLTDITITNTSANNIYVEIKDGTTVMWTFPVPANSGVVKAWTSPLVGTAATAWNFDPSAATTTVFCSASGFKSKI